MKAFGQLGGSDPQRGGEMGGGLGEELKCTLISQDCMLMAVLAASETAIEKDACCVRPKEGGQ